MNTFSSIGKSAARFSAIALAAFLTMMSAVLACQSSGPPPSSKEIAEAEKTFSETESSIQRIVAFGTLMRIPNASARQALVRLGYSSDDVDVRAAALRCEFLESNKLNIESLPLDDADEAMPSLTDQARKLVAEGRAIGFPFYYTDAEKGCASINHHYDEECKPRRSATVSGLAISVTNDGFFGRFELGTNGELVGQIGIWHGSGHHLLPAKAMLD